jgi:hypothetical protein
MSKTYQKLQYIFPSFIAKILIIGWYLFLILAILYFSVVPTDGFIYFDC